MKEHNYNACAAARSYKVHHSVVQRRVKSLKLTDEFAKRRKALVGKERIRNQHKKKFKKGVKSRSPKPKFKKPQDPISTALKLVWKKVYEDKTIIIFNKGE